MCAFSLYKNHFSFYSPFFPRFPPPLNVHHRRIDSGEETPGMDMDCTYSEHNDDLLVDDPQYVDDILRSWTDSNALQQLDDESTKLPYEDPTLFLPSLFSCPSMEECFEGVQSAWRRDMKFLLESGIGSDVSVIVYREQIDHASTMTFQLHRMFLIFGSEFFREKLTMRNEKQIQMHGLCKSFHVLSILFF
jgi:hypothetical protein